MCTYTYNCVILHRSRDLQQQSDDVAGSRPLQEVPVSPLAHFSPQLNPAFERI